MNSHKNGEILTKQEQFINLIYYIFRYILYGLGWAFLDKLIGEGITIVLMGIFVYLSLSYNTSREYIQEKIIEEERQDAFRKAKELDNEDEMEIF